MALLTCLCFNNVHQEVKSIHCFIRRERAPSTYRLYYGSSADKQFSALSSKKGKETLVEFSSASLDDTSLRAAMGGKSIAPMNTSRWNEQLSCLCMNIKAEQQLDL
ncbi:hypothetical protein HPP92_019496 [Vanilla planifolia]|uniref:Uncharacterized protein n=1 Tax=Vanilla planifolia TaxID=51239 RepID=A0A835Q9Q4_VANPL|nr:hypothetical protein HPP92_019496 [Vanilla planifolia]